MSKNKIIKCISCGKERSIKYKNPRDLCVKCAANNRKKCLSKDESIFQDGRKRKAKLFICPACKIEKFVRSDHYNKTGLCQICSARKLMIKKLVGGIEHPSYKNGIALYQKNTYQKYDKICIICNSENNIQVHHKDCNRQNNKIENLIPLCCSCHTRLHHKLKKGISYNDAVNYIKLHVVIPRKKERLYRRKCIKNLEHKCVICKKNNLKRFVVHHKNNNRNNNSLKNLVIVCYGCHRIIHWQIKKGIPPLEAFEIVKNRKLSKKNLRVLSLRG